MSDPHALEAALEAAQTPEDILAALARAVWHNAHDGDECPADAIPSEADLTAWLPDCPDAAQTEAREAVAAMGLIGPDAESWKLDPLSLPPTDPDAAPNEIIRAVSLASWRWEVMADPTTQGAAEADLRERIGDDFDEIMGTLEVHGAVVVRHCLVFAAGLRVDTQTDAPVHGVLVWTLPELHQRWKDTPQGDRLRHPLAPFVAAWQADPTRPREAAPFVPKRRAILPKFHRLEVAEARELPGFPYSGPDPSPQLALPGFESPVAECASWLLWLYDAAGGESLAQGRGAPWPLRLFVGALLHLGMSRRDGLWHPLRFPHLRKHEADFPISGVPAVERWLHPDGWTNRRRDWERLPEALATVRERLAYLPIGGANVAIMFPSAIPTDPDFPFVEFTVRIPKPAAHGARVDWPQLCRYGTESAPLYRTYLSAMAFLDQAARAGNPITAEIGAPQLRADGKPKRRKGGTIVRSRHDMVPNPLARFVTPLSDADLTRMMGFDPSNRFRRRDARKAFDRLHDDGVIDLRRERSGVRLFGPSKPAGTAR